MAKYQVKNYIRAKTHLWQEISKLQAAVQKAWDEIAAAETIF
jgi:hypothetical protein